MLESRHGFESRNAQAFLASKPVSEFSTRVAFVRAATAEAVALHQNPKFTPASTRRMPATDVACRKNGDVIVPLKPV